MVTFLFAVSLVCGATGVAALIADNLPDSLFENI